MASESPQPDPDRRQTSVPQREPRPPGLDEAGSHLFHSTWSGPLPPPEQLLQYEQTHPGLAERIVVVFERQVAQRFHIESRILDVDTRRMDLEFSERRRGQYLAFVLCLTAIMGGTWAGVVGHQVAGSVIGGTGLAGLAAAFIYGRASADKR